MMLADPRRMQPDLLGIDRLDDGDCLPRFVLRLGELRIGSARGVCRASCNRNEQQGYRQPVPAPSARYFHSCFVASRAPSASACNLTQTTEGCTSQVEAK